MAIAPTGAIYKSLIFDGEDSRDYGVYITGEAVYNAPERDVEMIAIPGRDGAFALDKGRFENIEVKYPAGIVADNEADFAEAISDFRNFLCSKIGYCRLEDGYNSDEYRMAIYKSGLEVSPTQLMTGEFELIFECKPQRWLKSGETAVAVSSGDTLTNPTLFASSPMLEVEGYGNIAIGGHNIEISNATFGNVSISGSFNRSYQSPDYSTTTVTIPIPYNKGQFNIGDTITIQNFGWTNAINLQKSDRQFNGATLSYRSGEQFVGATYNASYTSTKASFSLNIPEVQFVVGTSDVKTVETTRWLSATAGAISTTYQNFTFTHNSDDGVLEITVEASDGHYPAVQSASFNILCDSVFGVSTLSVLGHPEYVDCDLGEAYKIENDQFVSLNAYIDLGSDLPTLAPGANTITFDNTITDLQIVPRWWKI